MECLRCRGLMVQEQLYDFNGTQGFMRMEGRRCVNCGHVADPLIEANHRMHAAALFARADRESEQEPLYLRSKASHEWPHMGGVWYLDEQEHLVQ